ncbi:hypothetical protein [Heyndrickxia ginsengihumi]|uniref:Spore coat protein n=1 Tax=Heyndrickxia ginsengihumi TaxID=363870 RepID=A0A0A6VCI2_9BACI|nr:hypothetical protein [Heyndrickxia ginsengihumi]KHD84239.1 hypothetical protein NG54_16830 [Heyndrickxia ginsengihumi]MBE6185090.1 hypothetical protein [Bacillus sp. (in: firmicutes)]MCM3023684.1 hypothetical protein [Heyndrickxia ginsengihumi]NEY19848.1 hypothetical protein [Heyndrickxia ginsengihumi]
MFPWNMFPFKQDMSQLLQNMDVPNLSKYMNQAFSQAMPDNWQEMFNQNGASDQDNASSASSVNEKKVKINIFETLDFIFIQLTVEQKEWLERVKIFHTSHQAILENIPEAGDKQTIALPALVKRKGTTAQYRNGILEIRLIKNKETQLTEINILY